MDGREDKDAQNNPTENPSVTPGAIFTPQEELIEVEETTPTVEPPAVIQPIPVNPNVTTPTGTGDIKLPGKKKSHRKIWVIFAIVALLGVIAAGVVFAMMNGLKESHSVASLEEVKRKFDLYANYLLFESSSDELAGNFIIGKSYALDEQLDTSTQYNAVYWDTAENLLTASVEAYSNNSNSNSNVVDYLSAHQANFKFLMTLRQLNAPDEAELIKQFLAGGSDVAHQYVDNLYSRFTTLGSSVAKKYAETKLAEYEALLGLLSIYNNSGCITETGLVDSECVNAIVYTEELRQFEEHSTQAAVDATSLVEETVTRMESDCWRISAQILEVADKNGDDSNE